MGCGASKAAQVDESAITINKSQDRAAAKDSVTAVEDVNSERVLSQPGVAEPTTTPPPLDQSDSVPQPSASLPSPTANTNSLPLPNEVSSRLPKPIAYEIPLNEEGKPMARKPFARRLEVRVIIAKTICIQIIHIIMNIIIIRNTLSS